MDPIRIGDELVVIEWKEYQVLVDDSLFLENLRAAGVDNWDGYHHGYSGYDEDED